MEPEAVWMSGLALFLSHSVVFVELVAIDWGQTGRQLPSSFGGLTVLEKQEG